MSDTLSYQNRVVSCQVTFACPRCGQSAIIQVDVLESVYGEDVWFTLPAYRNQPLTMAHKCNPLTPTGDKP